MFAILLLVLAFLQPVSAQFSTGGTRGGKTHIGAAFDTTLLYRPAVFFQDTTIALSVKNLVAVNLHDPAQVWSYDAFRAAETNTSLWRTDAKRVPDVALLVSRTAGDSLSWIDAMNPSVTATRLYLKAASNVLGNVAINDLAYLDGTIWLAQAGTLAKIDELADQATQWTTSGQYDYAARMSSRNAASGYLLLNASPAIVNNTVNAVAAIRSPWLQDGHWDELGRQRQYWEIGTDGGQSRASYNALGTLSIYDDTATLDGASIAMTPGGQIVAVQLGTPDQIDWWYNTLRVTGDAAAANETWTNAGSGSEDLRWSNATVISDVAMLPGVSASGNNSPRVYAVADSGLYILDAKANDNTNGSKQEINARYVSPVMIGDVRVAFSGASTADPSGAAAAGRQIMNQSAVAFVADAASPAGSYANFSAASSDYFYVKDNSTLTFTTAMSIAFWVNRTADSGAEEGLVTKWNVGGQQSWEFFISSTDDLVMYTKTSGIIGNSGPIISAGSGWHYVVGTYDGANQRLYVDGILVDADAQTGNLVDNDMPLAIGAEYSGNPTYSNDDGFWYRYFGGRITGVSVSATVMTAQQIQDAYQRGLRMIQSPSPDTLYTAAVTDVTVNPYTGDLCLVHSGSVEIRDKWGALVDTLMCSTCGTIADCDFFRIAGVDSLGGGVAFGGSTGTRIVVPDVRAWDLAQAHYDYTPYVIEQPAVVDSTGFGDFWTLDDAVAAVNNVGRNFVQVLRGTYPSATVSQAGMVVEGAGDTLTVFDGLAAAAGLTVSGADVTVRDLGARTTPGGGGAYDAFLFSGATRLNGSFLRALGADDECFYIFNTNQLDLVDIAAHRCDDEGVLISNSDNNLVTGEVQNQSGTSVWIVSNSDANIVGPIRTDGAVDDDGTLNVIIAEETAF